MVESRWSLAVQVGSAEESLCRGWSFHLHSPEIGFDLTIKSLNQLHKKYVLKMTSIKWGNYLFSKSIDSIDSHDWVNLEKTNLKKG